MDETFKLPGAPYLYIQVSSTNPAVATHTEVQLKQNVRLERNAELALGATTWDSGGVIANPTAQAIRDFIKDQVHQFLNAWLSVNPKK